MKKIRALILAVLMMITISACSSEKTGESNPEKTKDVVGTVATEKTEEPQETTETTYHSEETSFQELTVVDNASCTIKITGIDPDNMWGYTLKAYLENKSADKTYMFSVVSASINGVKADPFFATEVAAGKKSNETITFSDGYLNETNIGKVTDIELEFRVYDSNDWMAEPVAETSVHVYPYGEENATLYTREIQDTDTVIVDNDFVTAVVTDYENDDIWGYTVNLFLVNKTDTSVMFSVDEASVNGYMADPFFATSVGANKCAFSSMSWSDDTLEANGISDVESIEFVLRVYREEDWTADDLVNEKITLNP